MKTKPCNVCRGQMEVIKEDAHTYTYQCMECGHVSPSPPLQPWKDSPLRGLSEKKKKEVQDRINDVTARIDRREGN